jgi:hypothetical protein
VVLDPVSLLCELPDSRLELDYFWEVIHLLGLAPLQPQPASQNTH